MTRGKRYIDIDVLTAARDRIRHIFDIFDTVAVCFSGGKDSLVVLNLVHEIALERGQEKVNVIFRDEEVIPNNVIAFVDEYRRKPWVNMLYFAVPLASQKYILGRTYDYVQWDPTRRHIRPIPEHAITLPCKACGESAQAHEGETAPAHDYVPQGEGVFDQYTMDAFAGNYFKGKVAFCTGIRSAESLMRFRASVSKLSENYITGTDTPKVHLAKPIYDWEENDVFRYFYDQGIDYCPIYDSEIFAGSRLRVATPMIAESAKRITMWRRIDPEFYSAVLDIFPEMAAQDRYYKDIDFAALERQYGQSFEGIASWIEENITDEHQLALARDRVRAIKIRYAKSPDTYPTDYVLRYFMSGAFKRMILPLNKAQQEARR